MPSDFLKDVSKLAVEPFRIIGGVHYVGNSNVSAHLVETSDGHILMDTAFGRTVELLCDSITKLGFDLTDIKLIIGTHGHEDHVGGHAEMKKRTGAQLLLGRGDVNTVEKGTPMTCAEHTYGITDFATFAVDRPLDRGDIVLLGEKAFAVHSTPGHTPGTISLTWTERDEDGADRLVGAFGGPGAWTLGHEEQGYAAGPLEFVKSLEYLEKLPIEVWLGVHPGQSATFAKHERLKAGETPNPFIDPKGWKAFIRRLRKERAGPGVRAA